MIFSMRLNKIFKYRTSITHFSHCPTETFASVFYTQQSCNILKNTGIFSHGSKKTTFTNHSLEPKSPVSFVQSVGPVRKHVIILDKWNSCCNSINGFESIAQNRWIHSDKSSDLIVETVDNCEANSANASVNGNNEEEKKKKRKKLKGKRAVVKWLKFFRWKKKKEYERMTAEEKILYKLNKARKKEERFVEALRKIEPADSSETTHDPEILTPEEHFFFLKMGLKGKNYVPVGRRGIYQGVILNMHLHWKKHQTVKVIVKTFSLEEVKEIAFELARLTGGLVLDIHEENTIIMYRGKNYSQPPTEIMSPRITLPRKKALDKSKYRDGLRAVRKHIPKLEYDLKLLQTQAELQRKGNDNSVEDVPEVTGDTVNSGAISSLNSENSGDINNAEGNSEKWSDSLMDTGISSDSEDLSDMFETDSDSEVDEKMEQPLYLKEFEKFAAESEDEAEDLHDQLRQMSMDSKEAKSLEKDVNSPAFDEVDRLFLRAASLLKKRRR